MDVPPTTMQPPIIDARSILFIDPSSTLRLATPEPCIVTNIAGAWYCGCFKVVLTRVRSSGSRRCFPDLCRASCGYGNYCHFTRPATVARNTPGRRFPRRHEADKGGIKLLNKRLQEPASTIAKRQRRSSVNVFDQHIGLFAAAVLTSGTALSAATDRRSIETRQALVA